MKSSIVGSLILIVGCLASETVVAKMQCYGIKRDGKIAPYPISGQEDCLREARLYQNRLGPKKEWLSVKWGDIEKADAFAMTPPANDKNKSGAGECDLNHPKLREAIAVVPNIVPGTDGQISGLRIVQVKDGSPWQKADLKSMDIIVEINGVSTRNGDVQGALKQLKIGKNNLTLERAGGKKSVGFDCTLDK